MRIIAGELKGRKFYPPKGLPVRPTTDFAKEGIFNIILNNFDIEKLKVLDLFAGTGNISYEFASRGCTDITAVDKEIACLKYIRSMVEQLELTGIDVIDSDVMRFVKITQEKYDIIFADPPYAMRSIYKLVRLVMENDLLLNNGWFILEHEPQISFNDHEGFIHQRKYGSSIFSIFGRIVDR